jgi:hypothetical protein
MDIESSVLQVPSDANHNNNNSSCLKPTASKPNKTNKENKSQPPSKQTRPSLTMPLNRSATHTNKDTTRNNV